MYVPEIGWPQKSTIMKLVSTKIRKKRFFSEPFKRELVNLFESGQYSVLQLEKLYGVANAVLYEWIYKYSTFNEKGYRVIEMKASTTDKLKELENQVKELERLLGQKQIKVEYLEKLIELASSEYGIDIKKNSSTPHLNGSAVKKKK